MYSLEIAWLSEQEQSRLNAFHQRCLRRSTRIGHSFYSRVSNFDVLKRVLQQPLSQILLARQMHYFGKIACFEDSHPVRQFCFEDQSFDMRPFSGIRARGRPRNEWLTQMHSCAIRAAGSIENLCLLLSEECNGQCKPWKQAVDRYTKCTSID